eukprot:11222635-Lingulodinium_polyedra.AAC.1
MARPSSGSSKKGRSGPEPRQRSTIARFVRFLTSRRASEVPKDARSVALATLPAFVIRARGFVEVVRML